MNKKWLFSHGGQVHGPHTVDEMKELVKQGKIDAQDKIWADGDDPAHGVPAATALDFRALGRGAKTAIHGQTQLAAAPQTLTPSPAPFIPLAVPVVSPTMPVAAAAAGPVPSTAKKKSGRSHAGSKAGVPLKKQGSKHGSKAGEPLKGSKGGASLRGSMAGQRLKKSTGGSKAGVPLQKPRPALPPAPGPAAASPVPVAQPVAPPPGQSPLTLQERFRKAQFALEQWVDDDTSVDLVLAGDLNVIRTDPAIQAVMRQFQNISGDVVDRLWKHLEFVVKNRRSYYLALVQRNQS